MFKTILIISAIVLLNCHEFTSNRVVILNERNFENMTKLFNETSRPTQPWFVMFYAPWCGHCKRLIPSWESLGEKLQGQVNIAAVNCDDNSVLRDRFQIKGYPSLLYFATDGQVYKYKGERSAEKLEQFALIDYASSEPNTMSGEHKPTIVNKILDVSNLPIFVGIALLLILVIVCLCCTGNKKEIQEQSQTQKKDRSVSPDLKKSDKKRD